MNVGEVLLKVTQACPGFTDHRITFDGPQKTEDGQEYNVYTVQMQRPDSQVVLIIRPALPVDKNEDEQTWNTLIEAMVTEFNKYAPPTA